MAKTAAARELDAERDGERLPEATSPAAEALASSEGNVTPMPTVELPPDEGAIKAAMAEAGRRNRETQSAARRASGTATTRPDPKPAKPRAATKKAAAKPKAEVARVPGETFRAELKRLGLTNTQAAKALGVSPSSVSEYVGAGRGRTMAKDRWADAKAALAAFAKSLK